MQAKQKEDISKLIDNLFRHKSAQLVSTLTAIFGSANIDLAENVVQEAFLKAFQTWPYSGIPNNPGAWLTEVAKNYAINIVRRDQTFYKREAEIVEWYDSYNETSLEIELDDFSSLDNQLKMIFICCNPLLSKKAQICLTLKTVGGFSVGEIARAFLSNEEATRKLLTRAKQKIRQAKIPFEIPGLRELPCRIESVLNILYAIFNEGYSAYEGKDLIRRDLCEEAIRLAGLFLHNSFSHFPKLPTAKALLALMLLHSARLPARTDNYGNLVLLADQDRSLWDKRKMALGLKYLSESASGKELTAYHLEAHIAANHAVAKTYEDSDWEQILQLYDDLLNLNPSPVIALNRVVALGMVKGPEAGLRELNKIAAHPTLENYYLLPATFADFYYRLENKERAKYFYAKAIHLTKNSPEKRFITKRLAEI
jgi:RNA polymerase sigma-70 factor (ECF subfamily)